MSDRSVALTNCRLCRNGKLIEDESLIFNEQSGEILPANWDAEMETVDLGGAIVAPGFLELQTNGLRGFHFTHHDDEQSYAGKIDEVAKFLPRTGVTGFYATIPTVNSDEFKKVGQPSSSSPSPLAEKRGQ